MSGHAGECSETRASTSTCFIFFFLNDPFGYKIFVFFQEHMIQNEVSILRRVKHPNIVLLIEEVDTYSELYLVMELVKVRLVSEL